MSAPATGVLARLRQPVGGAQRTRHRVGGTPQVSLLPVEVRAAGAVAAHRRRLGALVVVAAIVSGAGVLAAQQTAVDAQSALTRAQTRSTALAAQTAKFQDVRALEQQIAIGRAAVKVGSSTMIDWQAQIRAVEAVMPSGYVVTDISANGATPLALYPQGSSILEPTRAATLAFTVTAPTFGEEFSGWIAALKKIPAYADSTASTTYDSSRGIYTTALTIHLGAKAFSSTSWTGLK